MRSCATCLVFVAWLLPAAATAEQPPARGTLLVATEQVQGEVFAQTVILLLHYDENGAMGVVVNRPTDVSPEEVAEDTGAFGGYTGTLYWGGPVQMSSLRALMRTETPPEGAEAIVGSVHQVPVDDALKQGPADVARLRLYIGYAGWGAGQLDHEMARGSWHVVPASAAAVFAEDPHALWERLSPPREHFAAARR